jgi:CubicO group peptidase (beta-lactamase class C family)
MGRDPVLRGPAQQRARDGAGRRPLPLRARPADGGGAGTRWVYNGGAAVVLARLIIGRPLPDYAKEKLFEPLEIAELEWVQGRGCEFISRPDAWKLPVAILTEIVLPALRRN